MSESIEVLKQNLFTAGLPDLGPGPRDGTLSAGKIERLIDDHARAAQLPEQSAALLRALGLLWHDHLDASHEIAQNISSADGSYVHGIMHRREPDHGNARYWFHRVGSHPVFAGLARRVETIVSANDRAWIQQCVKNGRWDPFAFIEACGRVADRPAADADHRALREMQRVEFEVLLERFAGADAC